jgi:hypothetical protein
MRKQTSKEPAPVDRDLEGGIEWIIARHLEPIENELLCLRANVEALKEARLPW